MEKFDWLREGSAHSKDKRVVQHIMDSINSLRIFVDDSFKDRIVSAVSRLHDEGVEIDEFIGSSRRIAFKGKYQGSEVAIKFSHAKRTIDHDEKQQLNEELIWKDALQKGDQDYFAAIILVDMGCDFVVQELCTDVRSVERDDLPGDYAEIAYEYGMKEIEIGFKNGVMKFVDFGTLFGTIDYVHSS